MVGFDGWFWFGHGWSWLVWLWFGYGWFWLWLVLVGFGLVMVGHCWVGFGLVLGWFGYGWFWLWLVLVWRVVSLVIGFAGWILAGRSLNADQDDVECRYTGGPN